MFVKTLQPEMLIGSRVYPKGSVVEVEEGRGKRMIDEKTAAPADGPAREPRPKSETPATTPAE